MGGAHGVAAEEDDFSRAGGYAALAIGAAYVAIIALYALAGAPPAGVEPMLTYLGGRTITWWTILGLSVLTDMLFIPLGLSLYLALRAFDRNAMRIALAFIALFVVLDLAVTWTNYAALLSLSADYGGAVSETQRAIDVAAATYASSVLSSHLSPVYAIGTLSFAILLTGIVMRKAAFGRVPAYLGIATGILGIPALSGAGVAIVLNATAATLWVFAVGYRLVRSPATAHAENLSAN